MNTSAHWQIPHVIDVLTRERPCRVLDVGCGAGKYGALAREYGGALQVVGVDASPSANSAYDEVYPVDLRDPESLPAGHRWDMALLIDVIEHLDELDGWRLLDALTKRATKVLVATPLGFRKQEVPGDPHATHRSGWYPWDFARRFKVKRWSVYPGHFSQYLRLPKLWQSLTLLSARACR